MTAGPKIMTGSCVVGLLGLGLCAGLPMATDNADWAVLGLCLLLLAALGLMVGVVAMIAEAFRSPRSGDE